jgi:hypothetical protein
MYYEENRSLESEDMGYNSPVYYINIHDNYFLITIGKERKLIQKKNTYYFPVYLMNKLEVQCQIGAFQFESSKESTEERTKMFRDKLGDLDLNRLGDLILYSFANYDYFNDITNTITLAGLKEMEEKYLKETSSTDEKEDEDSDREDIVKERKPFELDADDIKQSASMTKTVEVLKHGIFNIDKTMIRVALLPEESREDSERIKTEYIERTNPCWVEKYMNNNNYDIVDTNANGDCLFDSVRLAFEQIGHITTIQKLRAIVAQFADERFADYRELFLLAEAEIASVEKQLKELQKENKSLKQKLLLIPPSEREPRRNIITMANAVKAKYDQLKETQKSNREYLSEVGFVRGIDTIDKFRKLIQTPAYWADEWAISVLEKELNIKLCIFDEAMYKDNDENNVMKCSFANDSTIGFSPDYYIMVTYSGDHYRLITYKTKRIFKFSEIPYDVKTMTVIKCMEKNAGVFSTIPDFIKFKARLGIQEDTREQELDTVDSKELENIDETVIFTFYNKAGSSAKPGKGTNETIPKEKIHEYKELGLKKNTDWRKKLDDDWSTIFTLDGKKWKTVEHYYQASKFKKHNPDFYNMFSLDDTSSEFATDVELAKLYGSQEGTMKKGKKVTILRPTNVRIDPDFYGNRQNEERQKALYSKFTQNEDLKDILLATKLAVLQQYIPKQPPVKDVLLMKVRQQIFREQS